MKRAVPLLLTLAACGAPAPPFQVEVTEAMARTTRPGAEHSAAYFRLENTGSSPARLVGAAAVGVRAVELHRTVAADGIARMEQVEGVDLAPGEAVAFAPGGFHVMLIGVDGGLQEGDTLVLALAFATGDTVQVDVPAR